MFAQTGAPGNSFPHPGATLTDDLDPSAPQQPNTAFPWDSPRGLSRTVSLPASAQRAPATGAAVACTPVACTRSTSEKPKSASIVTSRPDHLAIETGALAQADQNSESDEQESESDKAPLTLRQRIRLTSNYIRLYRYCDRTDALLLLVGTLAAIASGVPLPLIGILFGQLIDSFNGISCSASGTATSPAQQTTPNQFMSSVNDKVKLVAIVAAANFAFIWIYTTCWSNLGERIVRKMRARYLASVLRQDMAFFDKIKPGQVGTSLSSDLLTVQNGTSEKMGILISSISYFVTSYIVAFIKLPVLAAQLVSLLPAFALISLIGSRFVSRAQKSMTGHLAHAASLAAEALNNLTVVQAFGVQNRLSNIYQSHLDLARKSGTRKALSAALVLGLLFFVGYSANALAFFSGSNLIADASGETSTVGAVYTVIFLLLDASFIIGQIAPYLQIFNAASGAGQTLIETIDKQSAIDGTDRHTGLQPANVDSIAISFDNVTFSYPSRKSAKALDGISINVPAGKRVAIVGMSGSGKSTIAALTQRFYDPCSGAVRVNGADMRDYNVRWLRAQMGVVGQEPVLFDCSILQSIAHGLLASPDHEHMHDTLIAFSQVGQDSHGCTLEDLLSPAQRQQLEDEITPLCHTAARMAGAHDFILKLPRGYETRVGSAGSKLSGGQKQRICIARALVRQPKLLILDEATAALDSHSERTVTAALDNVSAGRTTIAIAHRLATIRNYDKIIVVGAGKVLEQGSHKELLALRGYYYKLAEAQDTNSGGNASSSGSSGSDSSDSSDQDEEEELSRSRSDSLSADKLALSSVDEKRPPTVARALPNMNEDDGQDDDDQKAKAYPKRVLVSQIGRLIRREWLFIIAGLLTSTVMGGSYSGEAVLFGHVIDALNPCKGEEAVRREGRRFALFFFILALIQLTAYSLNGLMWGTVAERLLFRIRRLSFETLVSQRLVWYEKKDKDPASMIAALSNDANNLGGLTGTVIGTIFCIFVNLTAGIILSHAVAWRIAVVILAMVPIILASGYMRLKVLADFQKRHETAYVRSNALAIEAVSAIRTVASLGREEDVTAKFERSLVHPYRAALRHFVFGNIFLAIALSISYFIYAFAYWWGSRNVAEGRYSQVAFFTVLPALLFSAQASGQLLAFAPDFSKAHVSAANLLSVIDRHAVTVTGRGVGGDDAESKQASEPVPSSLGDGPLEIAFDDVWFTYATRSEPALRGVSLRIPAGSFAALVGSSGSGKSTAMSLLPALYPPSHGSVRLNGLRASPALREHIALVPQEPVIFYGTVRFNVALGMYLGDGAGRDADALVPYVPLGNEVAQSAIEDACRLAGIHSTIEALPEGYDTLVCGSTLSGGQKQRLAIARALIRKPRLLLLDESTSALDAASETAFQATLETIVREGRTTVLLVAHRMRTVRDAEHVFIFDEGAVVEHGSYRQLLSSSARFQAMVAYQSLV